MAKESSEKQRSEFVDFKAVKAAVTLDQVLERYGVLDGFKRQGERLTGPCPVHKGTNARQFSVDLKKGAWKCFSGHCGKGGNVIDLVAAMEAVEFRKAALLLQEWFSIGSRTKTSMTKKEGKEGTEARRLEEASDREVIAHADGSIARHEDNPKKEVETNTPLSFELKLDSSHPDLIERGLTPETVSYFGLGYSGKGSMKNRIAIPIHNEKGELVAYGGRWVGNDADIPAGEGKYKLPGGFHKSLVVYNLHRVPKESKRVIVVEGFWSVFWLHQNGFPHAVSLMGSTISPEQGKLLSERFKGVEIFFDGDDAGREGARKVALALAAATWVRIVDPPDGMQPDRLPLQELKRLFS